jgi:hypothetical protein
MKLIEQFDGFAVYEHHTGRGVIMIDKNTRGPNAALFASTGEALSTGLAVAWGKTLTLTHRLQRPVMAEMAATK